MSDRRKIRVELISRSVYGSIIEEKNYGDDTIADVIAWLADILASIPEADREGASISFDDVTEYDSGHIEMSVYYNRDETDEEMASRIAAEKKRADDDAAAKEANERAAYEVLKKKFG